MSDITQQADLAVEVSSVASTHTADTSTKEEIDVAREETTTSVPINDGGDTVAIVPHCEKVAVESPESTSSEKKEVEQNDDNLDVIKTETDEAVAKSPASDVLNAGGFTPSNEATVADLNLKSDVTVQTNVADSIPQSSNVVIIQKGIESSSDDENADKKTESICSERALVGSVDNESRPEDKNSLPTEPEASGSEAAGKIHQNGRRKGNRNRAKSGSNSAAASRSDTENNVEPGAQDDGSHVRRNSFRRPFRGGRRGRQRGRGRGGFSDGGLSSPPFRQNFGDTWNYGGNDVRYRQSDYNYRASNGDRDRPGYYAARIVSRGPHNKPKPRNDELANSIGNGSDAGATESVHNSQPIEANKRGRKRYYRNRTRSGRFVNENYENNEVVSATGGLPVNHKGRDNYYRYYRPQNYYPRYDYHGQLHGGFYHGYYLNGGYRPYYGYGNAYGYGRGSSRRQNGGSRRGGFRSRSKSNANHSESAAKSEESATLNGAATVDNGPTAALAIGAECSSEV